MDFGEWTRDVRLHTLTEAHGEQEARRLMARHQLLVPDLPDDRHPGSATRVDSESQSWPEQDETLPLLLRRRPGEGGGVRTEEEKVRVRTTAEAAKARDAGLSVEQWRALAR